MVLLLAGHSSCYMLDRWTEYLQYGGQIDVMYSDFEKTFDKVRHPHGQLTSTDLVTAKGKTKVS